MDEGLGALLGIGLAIAAVVWIVGMVLLGFAWLFAALTELLGHPIFVLAVLAAIGAAAGLIRMRRRAGPAPTGSSDDFARIGPVRLTPDGWAGLVLAGFTGLTALYGLLLV